MIRSFLRRVFGSRGARPDVRNVPEIIPRDRHGIGRDSISACALRVTSTLQDNGYKAFVVGGAVRDLLIGRKPKDFDVATDATPEQAAALFRRSRIIGRRFRLVHVMCGQELVETATFRGDGSPPADAELDTQGEETADAFDAPEPPPASGPRGPRGTRPRTESGPGTRQADQHGRLIRDNVFGTQQQDAARRDFTVNALFYDPRAEEIVDYHHGLDDLRKRQIRMIGDPATRYREDPVRMLRAVRFASSIGFEIEASTRAPIRELAPLLSNVPPARLFDEMLKLLQTGHALASIEQLQKLGLHKGIYPLLDVVVERADTAFVKAALLDTDRRVGEGKPVAPSFLLACVLWADVKLGWDQRLAKKTPPFPALQEAIDEVFDARIGEVSGRGKLAADMREIWMMQPRFDKRIGSTPFSLVEQARFRAGFDFLRLRAEVSEVEVSLADWWQEFSTADDAAREDLIQLVKAEKSPASVGGTPKSRRAPRRRKPSGQSADGEA